jgi:hypothetical protein
MSAANRPQRALFHRFFSPWQAAVPKTRGTVASQGPILMTPSVFAVDAPSPTASPAAVAGALRITINTLPGAGFHEQSVASV